MTRLPDNVVELLVEGTIVKVPMSGENAYTANEQAHIIAFEHYHRMEPVLLALITKIQQDAKTIEMLEYQTKWRKRRP